MPKADDKIYVYEFSKLLGPSYIILKIQRLEGNSVDPDEMAHYELPYLLHYVMALEAKMERQMDGR